MCVLGKRLLKEISMDNCNKTIGGVLHNVYCNATTKVCDPYYQGTWIRLIDSVCVCVLLYNTDIPFRWIDWWFSSIFIWLFTENNLTIVQGIKGLASGVFFDNLAPSFLEVR